MRASAAAAAAAGDVFVDEVGAVLLTVCHTVYPVHKLKSVVTHSA
jgi:hypothetical protein